MARRVKLCSASRSARRGRSARKNARRFCWDVSGKGNVGSGEHGAVDIECGRSSRGGRSANGEQKRSDCRRP